MAEAVGEIDDQEHASLAEVKTFSASNLLLFWLVPTNNVSFFLVAWGQVQIGWSWPQSVLSVVGLVDCWQCRSSGTNCKGFLQAQICRRFVVWGWYIQNQQRHHVRRTFREEYVQFLQKFKVDHDERYIFKPA